MEEEKTNSFKELLEKAIQLSSQRKPRSDKGCKRKKYTSTKPKSESWKYSMVLSKLLNKAKKIDEPNFLIYDENGYYIDIESKMKPIYGEFKQIKDGKTETRHVKYIWQQKPINLEKYRFNAWLEKALGPDANSLVPLPNYDLNRWALECAGMSPEEATAYFKKRSFTWLQLFCVFYHIKEEDIAFWDYDSWREYYECCPKNELDEDFKFEVGKKPGTEEFKPEWEYVTKEKTTLEKLQEMEEIQRRVWAGKISSRRY